MSVRMHICVSLLEERKENTLSSERDLDDIQ